MVNKKTTSKRVAKIASEAMKDPRRKDKSVPGSDLSQVVSGRETSPKIAKKAAKELKLKSTSRKDKILDASAVSQSSGKKRGGKKR
jgi:hypothetical protein